MPSSSSSSSAATISLALPQETLAEINRRLLESGEAAKLESHLLHLLHSSGWTSQLRAACAERMKRPVSGYEELLRDVSGQLQVPEVVRVEVVGKIKDVLAGVVEVE